MIDARINDRWPLMLTEDRAAFHVERPRWEAARLMSMHEHLKTDMVVYDVGAECGDFSALYASWGCDVMCFEPQPAYWPSIRAHFQANDLDEHYLGGFVGFCADEADDTLSVTLPWPSEADGPIVAEPGFRHLAQDATTPRTTVDFFAECTAAPQAITIDVEGSEYRVLLGARETLELYRPLLWVSVHQDYDWMLAHYPGEGLASIVTLLEGYGYRGTELADEHELHTFWEPT